MEFCLSLNFKILYLKQSSSFSLPRETIFQKFKRKKVKKNQRTMKSETKFKFLFVPKQKYCCTLRRRQMV